MASPSLGPRATLVGCLILGEDGAINLANETALKWLDYSANDLVGRPLHSFLGPGGQFFVQSQIFPMLKLKGGLEEIYLRLRQRNGDLVAVLANMGRITDEDRMAIEFSFVRIPQRGRLEDELVQSKKLAEQASDSKTKFLGMMSHELRTPLGAISLNNQMLLNGEFGDLPADQKELIASSEGCVRSVTVLIDDILNFAQMRGGPVQVTSEILPIDLAISRAEVAIRHRFQHAGLKCLRGPTASALMAKYDPHRVQQILLNLLNNALKFTPKSGTISISAFSQAPWAAIEVSDTGCGIPPDQLARIFEPFVQLHSVIETAEKKGVGLGLAICNDLAAAMGGSIRVRSELGRGSTFSLYLPLAGP